MTAADRPRARPPDGSGRRPRADGAPRPRTRPGGSRRPAARLPAGRIRSFFETRLRGPADARRAVLASLAARSPWPLARRAVDRGGEIGAAPGAALRLGCLAEALAAGLETCALAHDGPPLPGRLQRARRVLVADTLLTLCWEIASELPERAFPAVAGGLKVVVGDRFLARVAAGRRPPPDPAAAASAFLERTLPLVARAARPAA